MVRPPSAVRSWFIPWLVLISLVRVYVGLEFILVRTNKRGCEVTFMYFFFFFFMMELTMCWRLLALLVFLIILGSLPFF